MPKNVMKLLKPSPHRARNDFDLSHRHVYSANFGELLPSTCIETVPGDHIVMHASNLLRAIPMVTSPFMRAKQHIDVWFVPYRDLWHNFDSFITQKEQPVSSALRGNAYLPYADSYDLFQTMSATDIVGLPHARGQQKLLNLLGYGSQAAQAATSSGYAYVNLFRLAAYNYIWYNEYRQKYYDDGTHILGSTYSPAELFNFDDLPCSTLAGAYVKSYGSSNRLAAMTQMRYRTWKKDLFTGLMPSTQFGSVSTVSNNVNWPSVSDSIHYVLSTNLNSDSSGTLSYGGTIDSSSGQVVSPYTDGKIRSSFDVLSLRRSEAIQIWRENALRAGNRVSDNMLAHYGVESDFRDHRPTYLGSVSAPLNIGDITTTANSNYSGNTNPNTNVGDIAGKGLSSLDEKVFTFDSKDFGLIMAIHSILPEAEYNAQGTERMNQLLESEDFFVPEYENLGLEAVSSLNFYNSNNYDPSVVGYAPRYYGYKTKLDKCFGTFMTGGINAPWCSPKYDVSQIFNSGQQAVVPLSTLYVNPTIFDVNFSVAYTVEDQFLCDVYFDVDAVRPMSVVGLPFS